MPYSSAADAPSYVPKSKRAQWVAVWNSAHAKALKDGKSAKDAEASAFAQANGVAKKESLMFEHLLTFGSIAKVVEAHLPMNQSHDSLRGHLRDALTAAHYPNGKANDYSWSSGPWVSDVFPNHVVYQHDNQTLSRSYKAAYGEKGTDPTITLGAPKAVHRAYVGTTISKMDEAEAVFLPAMEADPSVTVTHEDGSERVFESVELLIEAGKKIKESNLSKIPIKIIGPGWGSMAYYSKEMLKRDGPKVYTKGTPMFWNHATDAEESQRPEGDLNNLAAILTKDAEWRDAGPKGPGLYSEAKVFSDYATQVSEKGGHIGVSINAAIKGKEGTAEGRTGRIAEQLVRAFSADFVTRAGAGGAPVVPVQEADRGQNQERTMTEQEVKERDDLKKENDSLKTRLATVEESQNHVLAIATVGAVLKEAKIPFSQPLLDRACLHPTMKEGKLDEEWVKSVVKDFTHGTSGTIQHFGDGGQTREAEKVKPTNERLKEALKDLGVPEKGLDFAVAGRA